jgi:hypothetical protein
MTPSAKPVPQAALINHLPPASPARLDTMAPTATHPVTLSAIAGKENVSPSRPTHGAAMAIARPAGEPDTKTPKNEQDSGAERVMPLSRAQATMPHTRSADPTPNGILIRPAHPVIPKIVASPENPRSGGLSATISARPNARNSPIPAEPAQPTIQVTIGRLEVRANLPSSTAARAKQKKEPAMSLETYLQRRAEGGRR